ncbi:MAG: SLC13 family permease [Acidobacteriota bacterium]
MAVSPHRLRRLGGTFSGLGLFALMAAAPAPQGLTEAAWSTAAVGVLMAVWWMTEALPIPATALLPLVLFPLLGIASSSAAAAPYANPLIYLFLGGFLIALAMERCGLHRRVALAVLGRAGTRPSQLVGAFLLASAGLSMWISNTATALMMLPIALSVVALRDPAPSLGAQNGAANEDSTSEDATSRGIGRKPEASSPFALCLLLAVAYGANVGGMATLIGTPTNALLAGFMLETYGRELSFARWLLAALPVTIVGLVSIHLLLTRVLFPLSRLQVSGSPELLRRESAALGPWSAAQRRVATVFLLVAAAWMTRPLLSRWVDGLSDTGIALAGALLLFLLPSGDESPSAGDAPAWNPLLTWDDARRLPWGVLLLFGGGLSLAAAIRDTGLAQWIGGGLSALADWPTLALTLTLTAVVVLLTELTSNTATAAAFLPVLASVAAALSRDPLVFLLPATLAASCAFMLPVATPPNAIVYGSERVPLPQMARAGLWLNLLFTLLVGLWGALVMPKILG